MPAQRAAPQRHPGVTWSAAPIDEGHAITNLGHIPADIVSGETIWISAANTTQDTNADIVLADYTPAGGYTLAYKFAASTPISVAAAANGDDSGWTLEVTAAQTLLWKAGTIRFAGYVTHTSTGRIFAVDAGTIRVTASPMATSSWSAVVTACDAAIATYAANPHGSFSVDGMSVTYRSLSQLLDLRTYAQSMTEQETGTRGKRIIRTRFT